MNTTLNIISLGAGVQSSTMALMAAHGEIGPMPDAAIFADTGWEPKAVYEWLDYLEPLLPFPVYRVMHKEGLKASQTVETLSFLGTAKEGKVNIEIPVYTRDRVTNAKGMINRICTADYKILPVAKKIKELIGHIPHKRLPTAPVATLWIGISKDEVQRMKPSRLKFYEHRWPLIDREFTRLHCLEWMKEKGYPQPPRSSCLICPFHSNEEWRRLSPKEFQEAVNFDEFIRDRGGMRGQIYLHKEAIPLKDVDLTDEHHGQTEMFNNECEGMCGV